MRILKSERISFTVTKKLTERLRKDGGGGEWGRQQGGKALGLGERVSVPPWVLTRATSEKVALHQQAFGAPGVKKVLP